MLLTTILLASTNPYGHFLTRGIPLSHSSPVEDNGRPHKQTNSLATPAHWLSMRSQLVLVILIKTDCRNGYILCTCTLENRHLPKTGFRVLEEKPISGHNKKIKILSFLSAWTLVHSDALCKQVSAYSVINQAALFPAASCSAAQQTKLLLNLYIWGTSTPWNILCCTTGLRSTRMAYSVSLELFWCVLSAIVLVAVSIPLNASWSAGDLELLQSWLIH